MSVTLRNVAVTSRRNVANQRSNVIIIARKEGGAWELITRKRYSVGLADSAARGILQVNDNTPVKLKIIFAI